MKIILTAAVFFMITTKVIATSDFEPYRLSDVVRYGHDEVNNYFNHDWKNKYHQLYPESIASKYILQSTKNEEWELLVKLVREVAGSYNFAPSDGLLIVHLRIGDVIDNQPYTAEQFLTQWRKWINPQEKETQAHYVAPRSYFESAVSRIEKSTIKKIILVGGVHDGTKHDKTRKYVEQVHNLFHELFPDVLIAERITINVKENWKMADSDLALFLSANYFIPGMGGFGDLAARVIYAEGGIPVFGEDPWGEVKDIKPLNRVDLVF